MRIFKSLFLNSTILSTLLCAAIYAENANAKQIIAYVFDWDDNILFMPTQIVLFDKNATKEEILAGTANTIEISTGEFALERTLIGIEGKYKDYQVWSGDPKSLADAQAGSFKYFREGINGENYFISDLERLNLLESLAHFDDKILGPSIEKLIFALQYPEIAEWTFNFTARGQPQAQLDAGLQHLIDILGHSEKYKHLKLHKPPLENSIGFSHPKFQATMANPSEAKLLKAIEKLDEMQKHDFEPLDPYVVNSNGTAREQLHLFGFSDDDHKTFDTFVKRLSAEAATGRWSRVKIRLFYTGKHQSQPEKKLIVRTDGSLRTPRPEENDEAFRTIVQKCETLLKKAQTKP